MRTISRLSLLSAVWIAVVAAQLGEVPDWQTIAGGRLSFEVASVKQDTGPFRTPNFPLDPGEAYSVTGGRFSADFSLPTYITFAYKLSMTQEQRQEMVAHLPKWVATDRFDIQAKATNTNPTKDQMRLMMQSLLAERFKLVVHFETKESPVLALVLAKPGKLGPKLVPHRDGPPCDAPPAPNVFPPRCNGMMITMGVDRLAKGGSRDTTMALIASALPSMDRLGRTVVDRTGLSGRFDFVIDWTPEPNTVPPPVISLDDPTPPAEEAPNPLGASLHAALREQLGLKLEATKAPLQIIIIDHVERPSEN